MSIRQFFREGVDFIHQIYLNRRLIYELTKRDFKTKYIKNLFGLSWAIMEPLAMILILYIVFTVIYSQPKDSEYPLVVFMLCGLVAYDYFNKTINQATRSIQSFSFLIRQVNFRIAVLPLIMILSELIIHFIVLLIVIAILLINHVAPSFYWLQIFYFIFAASVLLLGISWFTASVLLFFPDIYMIISIVMRVLFFMTPIFWNAAKVSPKYLLILKINPIFYLAEGYRMCFLYHKPFWSDLTGTLIFWGITLFFFLLGVFVFKRLRPQFADVI